MSDKQIIRSVLKTSDYLTQQSKFRLERMLANTKRNDGLRAIRMAESDARKALGL